MRDTEHPEALFRACFDYAPVGKAVTGADGRWRHVNAALVAMLGYSVDELRATSFLALIHPDDVAEAREATESLLAGACTSISIETRFRAKDGRYVSGHVTTRLYADADGVQHFLTDIREITQCKLVHNDLRASEERYRRLFESAKDGILILDVRTGVVVDANPFMTELTGYARDELVGNRLWEIGPLKDSASSKNSFAELLDKDYVRYDDLPLKTRDGRTVEVEFVSNVYLVGDERVIQCNIRDISVRRRAENDLRLREKALEVVSLGILITDATKPDHPIIYASPGFARLTGYANEEIIGRNCRFLQSPDTDPAQISIMRDAIRDGRACAVELLNIRKDGTPFWNYVAVSPVHDAEGRVSHYVGVQTDVTARRQLEARYLQAQKMEAIGRVAGGVAHDFNNLLSVILGYSDLVIASIDGDESLRADVDEIKKSALRGKALTKQLLAFSRQQVLQTKVLSLNHSLVGMEKLLGRLLGAGIEVTMLPAAALAHVRADPGQVEQIIMNLAVNARDAMPEGGQLTIETANIELDDDYAREHHDVRAGAYVMMAVSDTGSGMDRRTLGRIFEPFYTTKASGKGTGLGLATVFGIVKQSGGHIVVDSEPDEGTTFKVYLPKVDAAIEADAPIETEREPDHRGGFSTHRTAERHF